MRCSNCGKDVPFEGRVCPHCHVDKSYDQRKHSLTQAGLWIGGIIGAIIGYAISGGGTAFVLFFIGAVIGGVIASNAAGKPPAPVAPTVQLTKDITAQPQAGTDEYKACPFCAETIKRAAIKCRFCQSDLAGTISSSQTFAASAYDLEDTAPQVRQAGSGRSADR